MARRPEDMGLTADPRPNDPRRIPAPPDVGAPPAPGESGPAKAAEGNQAQGPVQGPAEASPAEGSVQGPLQEPEASAATLANPPLPENSYTVSRALRTRAFYVMAIFSGAGFMVQAGVSLHQVSHFISQGMEADRAALTAGSFAFCQVLGGFVWSSLASRQAPIRLLLALSAFCVSGGALGVQLSSSLAWGLPAASVLGAGVGGLHLLLRLAWAEYYGREHLGSITGITLPVQVGGQALGPVIAGFLYDFTGSYLWPFRIFATTVFIAGLLVLTATPPRRAT